MSRKLCSFSWRWAALSLTVPFLLVGCADGVPLDDLFPVDGGRAGSPSHSSNADNSNIEGNDFGSAGNTTTIDDSGAGSGGAAASGSGGAGGTNDHAGGTDNHAGGTDNQAGGADNHAGGTGDVGSSSGCAAPAWDSMTIYCGQGAVGTEVSLNGKKYACHYWTQAQNPEEHNSTDNSEPWSTPTSCP